MELMKISWKETYQNAKKEAENISAACKLFVKENVSPDDQLRIYKKCLEKWRDENEMFTDEDLKKWGL